MSIYEETIAATGFDPAAPGPSIEFEDWEGVVPPPSLPELIEQLGAGVTSITGEWLLLDAELTMRRISAREDTGPLPIIDKREEGTSSG